MTRLPLLVKERVLKSMHWSEDDLTNLSHQDRSCLHDPFLYDGMDDLVDRLHSFKLYQAEHPEALIIIDSDYDTDGVNSSVVLSAALDVFNINYRIYIPSMADGYGLSPKAVQDMLAEFGQDRVHTILTADNGTNAVDGVEEAKKYGIQVLVTDHHLADGDGHYADAEVIVNPNKRMKDGSTEPYPFKGNAGATVAWKAMMAYAQKYQPQEEDLIFDLIVFAGIANVADVMPITDENHYMVKKSVEEFERLRSIRDMFGQLENVYTYIKETVYPHYNAAFHGLYDVINLLQQSKDEPRIAAGKKPIPLKMDEELISWYLSPMINAPRRVHDTSKEAMYAFLHLSPEVRYENIQAMIQMNTEKSVLRDRVLKDVTEKDYGANSNVLFVNARHGISGLIAGNILEKTGNATIIFSAQTDSEKNVYEGSEFEDRLDIIGASARSTELQPLHTIVSIIKERHPDIVKGGGGHAAAAGYSIAYKHYRRFKELFDQTALEVKNTLLSKIERAIEEGTYQEPFRNVITLLTHTGLEDSDETAYHNIWESQTFAEDVLGVIDFQKGLKPFGKGFEAQTHFKFTFVPAELQEDRYRFDGSFWGGKSFTLLLNGVKTLTWDTDLADKIKHLVAEKSQEPLTVDITIDENTYNGRTYPQFKIS